MKSGSKRVCLYHLTEFWQQSVFWVRCDYSHCIADSKLSLASLSGPPSPWAVEARIQPGQLIPFWPTGHVMLPVYYQPLTEFVSYVSLFRCLILFKGQLWLLPAIYFLSSGLGFSINWLAWRIGTKNIRRRAWILGRSRVLQRNGTNELLWIQWSLPSLGRRS